MMLLEAQIPAEAVTNPSGKVSTVKRTQIINPTIVQWELTAYVFVIHIRLPV
jgi:hypothetical protein